MADDNNDDEDRDAKAAREEAEARRLKILQSSQDRLGVVTGVVDEPEEVKNKSLSKMAAARRRRFKKKDDTTSTTEAATATATATPTTSGETKYDESTGEEKVAPVTGEVSTGGLIMQKGSSPPAADGPVEEITKETTDPVSAATSPPGESKEEIEGDTNAATKKKYRGVARIRRQMLKDKQQRKEDQEGLSATMTGEGRGATAPDSGPTPGTVPLPRRVRNFYTTLPILMHVVAVLLLFGAGLDVGLQQRPAPTAEVHTAIAPAVEFRILRVLQRNQGGSSESSDSLPTADELLQQADLKELVAEEDEDEFQLADDKSSSISTHGIDPLFGVDLDLYTQGDSFYMTLARFAIKLHRINLKIFYYGPRGIFLYVWQTLEQLAKSPPLLCLVAIVIRQVIAKGILGANLPKPAPEESSKDLMNTIKQFVQGFILKAFPTAVSVYDAWSHLRADMHVVLCGLLVGLAIRHMHPPSLGGVVEPSETIIVGGSDEL